MSKAVFFMIDGLRPDAIEKVNTPNLGGLFSTGASTLTATSVMPSITLPCHMSIFHSVPPTRHGVTTNDWQPMARPVSGLFERAHNAGLRCASFFSWEQLRDVSRPGHLEHLYFARDSHDYEQGDLRTAQVAANYLRRSEPDFAFIYFGTVDAAGHDFGWMSAEYLQQIERVDEALGVALAALTPDTSLVLQSDHGGHDRSHGTELPEDMTIPWLVAGPNVRGGYRITGPVSLLDTAPTLATLLGVAPDPTWEGRCIDEVFS